MIPFIWAGNLMLVAGVRFLNTHGKSYAAAVSMAILAKVLVLFAGFQILLACGAIPAGAAHVMSLTFGVYQLITGVMGAAAAWPLTAWGRVRH
jgi:uncharacterized protein YhhL (DUF1145 family)